MSKFAVDFTICNLPDVRLTDFQVGCRIVTTLLSDFHKFFVRFLAIRMAPASFCRLSQLSLGYKERDEICQV